MNKLISKKLFLITLISFLFVLLSARLVWGWTNPTLNPPGGAGVLNVSGGNVGIGTTAPSQKLEVSGGTIKTDNGIWTTTNGFAVGGNAPLAWQTASFRTGNDWRIVDTGHLNFNLGGGNSILHLNQNGNVGIGTVNPGSKLHIVGPYTDTLRLSGDDGGGTQYLTIGAGHAVTNFVSVNTQNAAYPSYSFSSTNNANTVTRMTIDASGNVGIGTASPGQKLTVAGTIESTSGGFKFPDGTTQVSAASAGLNGGGTINYVGKFTGTGTIGNSIIFDNGTNVGIGTTNPTSKLYVVGSTYLSDFPTVSSGGTSLYGWGAGNSVWPPPVNGQIPYVFNYHTGLAFSAHSAYGGIRFYNQAYPDVTGSTLVMNITDGNVGIGTASPEATLSVNGTMSISPTGNNYNEGIRIHPSGNGYSGIFLGAVPGMTGSGVGQWSLLQYPASSNYAFGIRYNQTDYFNISNTGQASIPNLTATSLTVTGDSSLAGNVGIGTTVPGRKLDVTGTIRGTGQGGSYGVEGYSAGAPGGYFKDTVTGKYAEVGYGIYTIVGNGTKSFVIDHPTKPGMKLVHAAIEGPESAVYYRGEGQLIDGRITIDLPEYFETFVRKENRSVLLTPKFENDKEEISQLAASSVIEGKFIVRATDNKNLSQKFYWEVKAIRGDIPALEVEQPASNFPGM
ncbi:MAG: hypothetical protein Athens071426_150 [Parcubacteria group bacterium Athens0714_26]|nr:MAG: hypothetical protein Athens101426_257 [Parcubacteria group bacterium Athens1014_26]TSD03606.1 MAG: hypothetical protein Athens071426_150 [Parcubacteria group bacterium Athens0714_26]